MGRTIKGTLYLRGKLYWLKYEVNGRAIYLSTKEKTLPAARRFRDQHLEPLKLKDQRIKAEAVKAAVDLVDRKMAETRIRTPIAQAWERFPYTVTSHARKERNLTPRSIKENLDLWRKFVTWAAETGLVFLDDVTPELAEKYRQHLIKARLSGNRVNKLIQAARVMYARAGEPQNPFAGMKLRADSPHGRRELSPQELESLFGAATGELRTLLYLGLFAGLRLGAAATVKWENVDTARNVLRFEGRERTTKNIGEVIPMHPDLRAELERIRPAGEAKGDIVPGLAGAYRKDPTTLSHRLRRLFDRAKIVRAEEFSDRAGRQAVAGFHSLRHTFVSMGARGGIPLHVLQAIAGHGPKVQELYLHVAQEDAAAISRLEFLGKGEKKTELAEAIKAMDAADEGNWRERWAEVRKLVCQSN